MALKVTITKINTFTVNDYVISNEIHINYI